MFASNRTGALRWLRLGLAVVALFAAKVNVTMGAFGTTCARADLLSVFEAAGGGASSIDSIMGGIGARFEAPHLSSQQDAVPLAAVTQCAGSAGAPTVVVNSRLPGDNRDSGGLPLARQLQPPSRETAPPFRPPRQS